MLIIFAALIIFILFMKNKEIQEARMKGYFIEATKELIKGEGLKSLSVRSIADKAGYSFATIYNYFRDVNDLVFLCVIDFQKECEEAVKQKTAHIEVGKEKLKAKIFAWAGYFVEYPGIFEVYYLAKSGELGHRQSTIELITNSLNLVIEDEWNFIKETNPNNYEVFEQKKNALQYQVIGILLLYLNRNFPSDYSEFERLLKYSVDGLFE